MPEQLSIYVVRKTLKSCREKTYDEDFVPHLKRRKLWNPRNATNEGQSPEYVLWGSTIKFIGLDADEELAGSDIVFINEALDINSEKTINNQIMRCRKLAIMDWNPKLSFHFLFKWEGRFNTLFTRTTWRDNKHIPETVLGTILGYCPWDLKDFDEATLTWRVPESERSPHPVNVPEGTANMHDYLVYDLGLSAPETGAVFKDVTFIDSFPDDCDDVVWGCDFGYSIDSTVLTKCGRRGKDVFIEYMTYTPFAHSRLLFDHVMPILQKEVALREIEAGGLDFPSIYVACDSADKFKDMQYVKELNAYISDHNRPLQALLDIAQYDDERKRIQGEMIHHIGFFKVKKPHVVVRLANMKKYRIHVVKYLNGTTQTPAVDEFTNYVYMVIEGREVNIPIDAWNHGIDSSGYAIYHFWRWNG